MPYDPNAPDSTTRERAYHLIWLGGFGAVFALVWKLALPANYVTGPLLGFAIGGVFGSALAWRADDYFQSLCAVGHKWMAAFVALYAFACMLTGLWDQTPQSFGLLSQGETVALMAMVCFYAGYAYAWLRNRY